MPDKEFIDTNVLVYAYDQHDPAKHTQAQQVLLSGIENESAILSAQVLGEFFNVVTRRIPNPLSAEEAEAVIDLICILPVVGLSLPIGNTGLRIGTP